jgi:hypothetical protein
VWVLADASVTDPGDEPGDAGEDGPNDAERKKLLFGIYHGQNIIKFIG